jgi:hypothetical protein
MFRKMLSVAAVLALLQVLTAGAVQARPLAAGPSAGAFVQELWAWVASGLVPLPIKDGSAADPNGLKRHPVHSGRVADAGRQASGANARGM